MTLKCGQVSTRTSEELEIINQQYLQAIMLISVKTKIMSNDFLQYIFTNCFKKILRKISAFLDCTFFLTEIY